MLAFILLVVLGGGVGLLAVSLAESPKPATDRGTTKRATEDVRESDTAPAESEPDPFDEPGEDMVEHWNEDLREGPYAAPQEPGTEILVPASPTRPMPAGPATMPLPRQDADSLDVPRAYTAIEGRLDEIEPPLWHRALSLIAIVALAVAVGVGSAAVAAAIIGAMAELLDNAIG